MKYTYAVKPDTVRLRSLLIAVAGLFFISLPLQAGGLGFLVESSVYTNSDDVTDGRISMQFTLSQEPHSWEVDRWRLYVNVLDVRINNGKYSEGVNVSDNYLLLSSSVLLITLDALLPDRNDETSGGFGFFTGVGLLINLPHMIPNLGFSYKVLGNDTTGLSLFLGQEMDYYFINGIGHMYALRSDLRWHSDDFQIAGGVRRTFHNCYGDTGWALAFSIGLGSKITIRL